MEAPVLPKRIYRFGLYFADPDAGTLLREGVPIKLQEQPLRVLCLLLERAGKVVTREELRQTLWPEGTYVEFDGSLNATLKRLRSALGDDADNPTFIETVPRRGYRFIAPVQCQPSAEGRPGRVDVPPPIKTALDASDSAISAGHRRFKPWWLLAAVASALALIFWGYTLRGPAPPGTGRKIIAVLPFSNEGAGPDLDYLRYALADELTTDLTYSGSVTVRPFSSTTVYATQPADPATVGKQLRVTYVVAGGFLLDKQNLRINLELVDVAQNQAVWREQVVVSPQDLVALHDKLAVRTTQGILPAVDVVGASRNVPSPKNEQALELFLHSLSIPYDPEPNLIGIKNLEESVALDSAYAPAWAELSRRYSYDFHYANGGKASEAKMRAAYTRQSELDPNWPSISSAILAEDGDLNGAYDQAADFLRRHPDVAEGHFFMSYDLLYAGLLDEAGQECEAALARDPGFSEFRACAVPFILQGDYAHAQSYIRLDEHSGFGAALRMTIALRSGDTVAALAESDGASRGGFPFAGMARTRLNQAPEAQLRRAATELEEEHTSWHDPEMYYFNAGVLSCAGQDDAALRQLRKAISGNFCSYPAMDKDPLFDSIRQRPEFGELRQFAIQCQQSFLAHRQQAGARLKSE